MIDQETCEEILRETNENQPKCDSRCLSRGRKQIWSRQFSDIGWAAWNDQIRNGVKGQNPNDGLGFIFGKHQGRNTKLTEQAFITETLREDGGLFTKRT